MNAVVSDQKGEFSQLAGGQLECWRKNPDDLAFAKGIIYNFYLLPQKAPLCERCKGH